MTGVIATIPRNQFFDALGKPLAGGKLYTYLAGTTKPATTYQDQALTVKNENGIPLDAIGSCSIWLDPDKSYKFVLKDKRGVTVPGWPIDNITGASTPTSLTPTLAPYAKLDSLSAAAGADLVGFQPGGVGAKPRTLQAKLRETMINVREYGARDDGLADDSTAEANALAAATSTRSMMRGLDMFKFPKIGGKLWKRTFGIKDQAAVVSITAGDDDDEPVTQVLGFAGDSDVGGYPDRDHVALFVQNTARPALIKTSNTIFTATSVTSSDLTAAIAAGDIRRGMMIDTGETPKKTGVINGASGSTITVSAWYVVDAARGVGTPAAGTTIYVNPSTKVWALNANVLLPADAMATGAVGFELGLVNDKTDGAGYLYDAVNLGSKRGGTAFQCRGSWVEGFHAYEGTNFGFISQKAAVINFYAAGGPIGVQVDAAAGVAFLAKGGGTAVEVRNSDGATLTYLNGTGAWNRLKLQGVSFLANTTIDADTVVCLAPPVSAVTIINLPTPTGVGANGQRLLYLKNPKSSTANVLWAGLVEDASGSIATTPGTALTMWSNGSSWIPIGKFSYT